MGRDSKPVRAAKAQNGGLGHRTQSAPRTHVARLGGAMALLRGLANAAGTSGAAVQALLRLLPDAAEAEPTADQVATTLGLHQRAGEAEGTPLTSLILAGRIPGRVRASESHPEEKVRRRSRSESADEKAESEKKGQSETGEEEYTSQEKEDKEVEEIRDSESEASLLDAEMDRALKEAQRKETGTGQKEEDARGNNFSPLKSLIRPAWEWWKRSPNLKPTEQPGDFGELEEGTTMSTGRKPKRRRDEPWRSNEARGAGERRANLSGALRAARRFRERRHKKLPIEDLFEANSSKEATSSRRKTLRKIMEALGVKFPLTTRSLMEIASTLKSAGYKAGVIYLVDCKLEHIEGGHHWTALLDRTFKKCKRGLERGRGPRRKAPEVGAEARQKARSDKKKGKGQIHFARELFEFGRCWMLREADLSVLSTPDVRVDYVLKRVRLNIPVSKMDQEAEGVQRVLQCVCGDGGCHPDCPYNVAQDLLDKLQRLASGASKLCVAKGGKTATKAMLVSSWQTVFKQKVTGHSARRTGALYYIREGWSIAQVAYLGRWKSSVILQYAEEALASVPANRAQENSTQENNGGAALMNTVDTSRLEEWKEALQEEIKAMKADMDGSKEEWEKKEKAWAELSKEVHGKLPAKVQSIRQQVVHKNLALSVASPPLGWRTACGWSFYGNNFVFVGNECEITCDKCKGLCA